MTGLYVPVNGKQLVPKIVKVLATKNVVQITCGYHHSVALTNGKYNQDNNYIFFIFLTTLPNTV